jgi:hypothetical protein
MKNREKLQYLEEEVTKGIKMIKAKGDLNKSRSFAVSMSSVTLGAFVTIALGLQISSLAVELKNFALVCGALISVVNAVDSIIGFRALWIKQKVTLSQLYDLRNEINFYKAGQEETDQISDEYVSKLFEKYQTIWKDASNEWLRLRKEQEQYETSKGG